MSDFWSEDRQPIDRRECVPSIGKSSVLIGISYVDICFLAISQSISAEAIARLCLMKSLALRTPPKVLSDFFYSSQPVLCAVKTDL